MIKPTPKIVKNPTGIPGRDAIANSATPVKKCVAECVIIDLNILNGVETHVKVACIGAGPSAVVVPPASKVGFQPPVSLD